MLNIAVLWLGEKANTDSADFVVTVLAPDVFRVDKNRFGLSGMMLTPSGLVSSIANKVKADWEASQ